jgi:enoyl-CoA hydratase/carnithine racemase
MVAMIETVLIEKAEGVLTITLNRPEKKNALTSDMYQVLAETLSGANDDPAVRVVLIQANGDMFTAGHDIAEFAEINAAETPSKLSAEEFLKTLPHVKKPLIAAVHGRAVGIGLTLLLHCDLVYVAEDALLSCPFVNLALTPEAASSLLLPERIGHSRAFQLFALGETIDGRTAAQWGLANAALPAAEVRAKARFMALALATKPSGALQAAKRSMRDSAAIEKRTVEELKIFEAQLRSPEAREAFTAFFEKRPPNPSKS